MKITLIHPEQMDAQDVDSKARELLAEELKASGIYAAVVIWPDTGNASLDGNEEEYRPLSDHFKRQYQEQTGHNSSTEYDKSMLDDQLLSRYEVLCDEVKEALKEQTMRSTLRGADQYIHSWRETDGWHGCYSGTHEGLYYESEDTSAFDSREEVEDYLQEEN